MDLARKYRRLVIICPMRSHCETVRNIFETKAIPTTYLEENFADGLDEMAECNESWAIVAGTGTGKTVFLKQVAQKLYGNDFTFDVVNREEESTPQTWEADVVIITTGIAMHWLKAGHLNDQDMFIIDEIHQTSEHLEIAMALARHSNITVSWMSATINPEIYMQYFGTKTVLECAIRDPEKRAEVKAFKFSTRETWETNVIVTRTPKVKYFLEKMNGLDEIMEKNLGVAVFVPTRQMAEENAKRYEQVPGLHAGFYYGGEPASKLRAYLRGEIPKPFIIFMTAAGSSALNIAGLMSVIIEDATFEKVNHSGVKVLERVHLSENNILQMAGRVDGRVKGSQVIILSERSIHYDMLEPHCPRFVLSGDLETVALTCARMEIELDELETIDPINRRQYAKKRKLLQDRDLISEGGCLTEFGQMVESLPVSRVWAEHLVWADDEIQPIVAVVSCITSLYNMLNRKGEYNISDYVIEGNDFLTAYSIVEEVINKYAYIGINSGTGEKEYRLTPEFYGWCKKVGVYAKAVKEILTAIQSVCKAMEVELYEELPVISPDGDLEDMFDNLLLEVAALDFISRHGKTTDDRHVFPTKTSLCGKPVEKGRRVTDPMICQINAFRPPGAFAGITLYSVEGLELTFQDIEQMVEKVVPFSVQISDDGTQVIVNYQVSSLGFSDFMLVPDEGDELSEEVRDLFLTEAKQMFIDWLAYKSSNVFDKNMVAENEGVIEEVMRLRQKADPWGVYSRYRIAKHCFEMLIGNENVYTLKMAENAGIDFNLRLDMFYSEQEIYHIERRVHW